MKLAQFLSASTVLALAAASLPAQATVIHYAFALDGLSEAPPNASPGIGSGTVDIDDVAMTMHIHDSFSGLTGTTTASHIHCCTTLPGVLTAGVATTTPSFAGFVLGVTSGTFDSTLDMTLSSSYNPAFVTANGGTTAGAMTALFAGIAAGKAYLNIHSSTFGGGEIRGFLLPVPEPASVATMLAGLLAIGALVRHQRRG